MTAMKERISNVIAWLGFGCLLMLPVGIGGLAYDEYKEKPVLIGEVQSCREIQRSTNANLKAAYSYLVDLEKCAMYKYYAAKWSYKGFTFGQTGPSSWEVGRLGYGIGIPGYTHNVGTDLAESVIPWALPLWLISIVLSYILFGSARVLPWKKVVFNEEAS